MGHSKEKWVAKCWETGSYYVGIKNTSTVICTCSEKHAKHIAKAHNCHDDLLYTAKKAQNYFNWLLRNISDDTQIPYEIINPLAQAIAKAEANNG